MVGPEHVIAAGGLDGNGVIEGVGHLAGHKPAPDQLIEPVLVLGQISGNGLRVQAHIAGADGFVGVLGGIFRLELPVRAVVIGRAVTAGDKLLGCLQRVVGQTGGVGTHIGNQTQRTLAGDVDALIQLLGNGHGAFGGHIQLPGRLLLEGGSNERRRGGTLLFGPLDAGHGEAALLQRGHHRLDFLDILQFPLFGVAVEPGLELAGLAHPLQHHVQCPILLGLKGADFVLPVHHHAGGHRLDPSGGQAPTDLLPKQGAQLIAHNAVQNAPGLLSVHQIVINATGRFNGLGDHIFRNLIERHPQCLLIGDVQQSFQMPGNGLAFPVRVGCQIDVLAALGRFFQIGNDRFLALHGDIVGFKIIFKIDAHLAFGQVPQVTHAGLDLILGPQILANGFGLGRRLHDHKIRLFARHVRSSNLPVSTGRIIVYDWSLASS